MSALKKKLLELCIKHVDEKINVASQAMKDAQEAANEEDKSSAGDKYETGRAMMQIERDNAAAQLDEAIKLKKTLARINANENSSAIELGSIVVTKSFNAFVAVGPGRLKLDGKEYFIVTPMSPLGKTLTGLKAGSEFTFNNKVNTILEIS